MSYSITETVTNTFTLTHAKHLAAKVATDLKRIQRFYGSPTDAWIQDFEAELTTLLRAGYLSEVTYGFKRDGSWIEPTVRYTSSDLAAGSSDDDPGRIKPNANTAGAAFYSYLKRSASWYSLSHEQQAKFEEGLPFKRGVAAEPAVDGYLQADRTYSAGGRSLGRSSVRSL